MEYIHLFETVAEYNSARTPENYVEPWVSYIMETSGLSYNKTEHEKRLEMPLTFDITSNGVIKWKAGNTGLTREIEYKLNDGEWTSITSTTGGTNINVVSGDIVQFRGDNDTYATFDYDNTFSGTTAGFRLKGNIMSLIDSDDFVNASSLTSSYTFYALFRDCTGLTDTSEFMLPSMTLANYCYSNMFRGCTALATAPELPATTLVDSCYNSMFFSCTTLTTAPELPATTLANACYQNMFYNCSSLTTAPELSATTLTPSCYNSMFQGCRALTTAPELPATTLTQSCYYGMFSGCTSLNYIKCLATDISASNCTTNWVKGVASTGTFVKNASMSSWTTGNNGIPTTNWTVQDA